MTELNRLTYPPAPTPGEGIRCTDFAAKIVETRKVRLKREDKAAAAKRKREAELRQQHLASVMQRANDIWAGLDPLMDQKIASAYDQAAAQLEELRDAYAQAGDIDGFQQKLRGFRVRYSNRPAMLRRTEKL
jgi:formate dehydrogenase maturation protein FdhE